MEDAFSLVSVIRSLYSIICFTASVTLTAAQIYTSHIVYSDFNWFNTKNTPVCRSQILTKSNKGLFYITRTNWIIIIWHIVTITWFLRRWWTWVWIIRFFVAGKDVFIWASCIIVSINFTARQTCSYTCDFFINFTYVLIFFMVFLRSSFRFRLTPKLFLGEDRTTSGINSL